MSSKASSNAGKRKMMAPAKNFEVVRDERDKVGVVFTGLGSVVEDSGRGLREVCLLLLVLLARATRMGSAFSSGGDGV